VGRELIEGQAAEVGHLIAGEGLLQVLFFNFLEYQMFVKVVNIGIQYHMHSLV
jgi:hypothetical protein